ncbi:MAG: hypothetical protein JJE44_12515 [Flavobacteriaceae bacterium]|nr:hypothetical protein [Flavobacteriaceae bacterium]
MKNSFKLKILKTSKTLTTEEQNAFRLKLQPLLKLDGIMSLCLEAEELYVEFNPTFFNLDSFKFILTDLGFPLEHEIKLVSL